ncbi:MAG: hypothetical protein HOP18_22805 [Deltaproteobacteria bacterium]|nr:hypothetical protein [Deltaproteobacteria bacterium]
MRRTSARVVGGLIVGALMWLGAVPDARAYFFDERREMSLSGFAYTRGTLALSDDSIGSGKGLYETGNLVQHRNFVTLEWRHNINRAAREMPTVGPLFQFMGLDGFDYYLNLREAYDGVYNYGPRGIKNQLKGGGGTNFWDKYYGRQLPKYPSELVRVNNLAYITNINFAEKQVNQIALFEWYFNITKGPLFVRIGRQNLSWGETDAFRLLDQINPLDNFFGGFLVPLDERRVPLSMLRAQWSFGTVGPINDLTLEGFISPDRRTSAYYGLTPSFWTPYTVTSPVHVARTPCGGPVFGAKSPGPQQGGGDQGNGVPCSVRAQGPKSNLSDSRGGGRLIGTIHDFTFSLAHYYTWQDGPVSAGAALSPTAAHMAWDIDATGTLFNRITGKNAFEKNASGQYVNNPWGINDPVVSAANGRGGPGANTGVPAVQERNTWVPIREKRVQITGASLSFPVNALTGMFVGSDNPLYYIYTTFRGEFAYTRNVGFRSPIQDGSVSYGDVNGNGVPRFQRFLTLPLEQAAVRAERAGNLAEAEAIRKDPRYNATFLPGGSNSSQGNCTDASGVRGCRLGRFKNRDTWAFSIGLDHNQWIQALNPANSFVFSAQFFVSHVLNNRREYDENRPIGWDNDQLAAGLTYRDIATIGPNRTNPKLLNRIGGQGDRGFSCIQPGQAGAPTTPQFAPCKKRRLYALQDFNMTNTLSISTSYLGGNLRPSFVFFYDWNGSWLMQPGFDWKFWDPFAVTMRYNWIDGNYGAGIGAFKTKDSIWLEFQYLLY